MNDFLSCIRIRISSCFDVHLEPRVCSPATANRLATRAPRALATAPGPTAAAPSHRAVTVTTQGLRRRPQDHPTKHGQLSRIGTTALTSASPGLSAAIHYKALLGDAIELLLQPRLIHLDEVATPSDGFLGDVGILGPGRSID
jgi:hypothetical protein